MILKNNELDALDWYDLGDQLYIYRLGLVMGRVAAYLLH